MPRRPLVTVLMSVHNDVRFVSEAVSSILGQSFGDFEFLIIDDASTDGTAVILRGLNDPRVRLYRNPVNLGITRSLNLGLERARGDLIARMDGDDIAEPDRLRRQVGFMMTNPDIGIVGTSRTIIDERGQHVATAPAVAGDRDIRRKCLLGNPFAHATVMVRRSVLEEFNLRYDEAYPSAEDYDLWSRTLVHARGANLTEPLLRYRLRSSGISQTRKPEQLTSHDRIALESIQRFVPEFAISDGEISELRGRFGGQSVRDLSMDPKDDKWQRRLDALHEALDAATVELRQARAA